MRTFCMRYMFREARNSMIIACEGGKFMIIKYKKGETCSVV